MRRRLFSKANLIFLIISLCTACSIDYGTGLTDSSNAPDFIFHNTTLTRVTNGKPRAIMDAATLEQYSSENCLYGDTLSFRLLTPQGDTTTVGSCDFFSINQKQQLYTFHDSVEIISFDQDMTINASNLRWNNKTEQMISDSTLPVAITTGTTGKKQGTVTTIHGTGLIVDGVTRTFSFASEVNGSVLTDETDAMASAIQTGDDE